MTAEEREIFDQKMAQMEGILEAELTALQEQEVDVYVSLSSASLSGSRLWLLLEF